MAALFIAGASPAAEVHVMISAGYYWVYSELGPAFERASGHRLITTRGPSMGDSPEAIPARLARGETADIVILDGGAADELGRRGVVPADQLAGKSRKVRGPPSGEPVAAVIARGDAEIGFQQVSELIHVPGITFVGQIPAELQPVIFFAAALTSTARQPEAASALIRFLVSPETAPVILKAGLTPLAGR